jgi:2-hydroxycyclohexanecarboxyl-CoA dehydrogenase
MSRVAVITGGASGMGLAVGRRLAARGDRVALLDLRREAALREAELLSETGARLIAGDIAVASGRASARESAGGARTRDDRVTSARLEALESFIEITPERWDHILAVNRTSTFHCLQAALSEMLAVRWGRVRTRSSPP